MGTHDLSYRRLFSPAEEGVGADAGPEEAELLHAFLVWMKVILFRRDDQDETPGISPEEFRDMLEKTVQQWNRELREEGRQEGREEGRWEGRQEGWRDGWREGWREGRREGRMEGLLQFLEQRFGPLASHTLTRLRTAREDQLQIWADRLLMAASLEDVFQDEAH